MALHQLGRCGAGDLMGALQWCFNASEMAVDIEKAANQYAEQIRKGE